MKNIFLSLLFLFFASAGYAQFGIKGGVVASKVTAGDIDGSIKGRVGLQGGVMWRLNLGETWDIRPEINYIRKGAKYPITDADVNLLLDYVELPLMFIYKTDYSRISVQIGPQFSYLVKSRASYIDSQEDDPVVYRLTEASFKKYDYGLAAGLGFRFKRVLVEYRFSYNLNKYNTRELVGPIDIDGNSTHFNTQLSIGCYFGNGALNN